MTLTLTQLESHLWGAADILRGKIDSADYKHYIFGLLFFKRLSDVWEEHQRDSLGRKPRFHIPLGASWACVRSRNQGIGASLNAAFKAIEAANPRLQGVIQNVDFDNRDRFPDEILESLLCHFERYRLGNEDVEADMLGNAYEYLIAEFAENAGKKGGEFYTPKHVVRLLVECLRPEEGMRIYDPTCGSGGMLLEAVHYVESLGQVPKSLRLFGQEMNLNTWSICQMNLFLHGIDDADIARGDTLRDPCHLRRGGKSLMTFDRVLANPPFSLKQWGHEHWRQGDPFKRDRFGCPPPGYGDFAFVQHMVASLAKGGMLGVVLPHGILFRGGSEAVIRRGLVKADLVEAVIGLGPNLFYGTGISACVLILRRGKPAERQGRILFVDGESEIVPGKSQNLLSDSNVRRLATAFHCFSVEEGFAALASNSVILEEKSCDLSISKFVPRPREEPEVDVYAVLDDLQRLHAERDDAHLRLLSHLKSLGYGRDL